MADKSDKEKSPKPEKDKEKVKPLTLAKSETKTETSTGPKSARQAQPESSAAANPKPTARGKKNDLHKQSVEAEPMQKGFGEVRRHPTTENGLMQYSTRAIRTLYDNFQHAVARYPNRPCLGTRTFAVNEENERVAGHFEFKTYEQVNDIAADIGTALLNVFKLTPSTSDKISVVGLYSKNREEWVIAEQACNMHSLVTVALYDTFGPENLEYVINHAELPIIFGSLDRIQNIVKVIKKCPTLKYLVCFEDIQEDVRKKLASDAKTLNNITIFTWNEVLEKVKDMPSAEPNPPKASMLTLIMYTSGTTGEPKGVMITHANLIAAMAGANKSIGGFQEGDSYLSYLPLAHIFERCCLGALLGQGLKIGFYQGDVKQFLSDVGEFKPTVLTGVPRIFDRIQEGILNQVKLGSKFQQKIFNKAFKDKEKLLEQGESESVWDSIVFKKVKEKVGGKLRFVLSGGAPLSVDTHKFVSVCFGCPVVQGYGLTETCAIGTIQDPKDYRPGEVGPPVPACEIKLVDLPDMNYCSTDDPPAGEVWIRGPMVSKGYYKQPEKTKEDFDADGWFHTGDVGTWTTRGTLKVIDRKKNIFKLAQGEYVQVEVLEGIYKSCSYLTQIWVYGESTERCLIAVGVVNPIAIKALAEGKEEVNELCASETVLKTVKDELDSLAQAKKLLPYEYIRALHLTSTEFTTENDYATPTMKLKRVQLKRGYAKEISKLYDEVHEWEEEIKKSGGVEKKPETPNPKRSSSKKEPKKSKVGKEGKKGKEVSGKSAKGEGKEVSGKTAKGEVKEVSAKSGKGEVKEVSPAKSSKAEGKGKVEEKGEAKAEGKGKGKGEAKAEGKEVAKASGKSESPAKVKAASKKEREEPSSSSSKDKDDKEDDKEDDSGSEGDDKEDNKAKKGKEEDDEDDEDDDDDEKANSEEEDESE